MGVGLGAGCFVFLKMLAQAGLELVPRVLNVPGCCAIRHAALVLGGWLASMMDCWPGCFFLDRPNLAA